TVTFSGGARGTVISATASQLTVGNLTGLTPGALSASVTVNSVSSGSPVQVATVIPVVTPNTANLPANATTLTINGFGFSIAAANDIVTFSGGAAGTVISATATQLTVGNLTGLTPGALSASVTVNGASSGSPVQVATVIPVVTPSTANLLVTDTSITISGFGFSITPANNIVTFSGGATGTVTSATTTQLTVTGLTGLVLGPLDASVAVSGISSGTAVQVATVISGSIP
ncbi:MAG TPA: IPT/TIG domain-containing protein, partial [Gemmataceae bacterium]|nr:IPT/TIG domain-containing protein [Gemmataceae bacterium]